jgi:hypothetical protein
VGTGILPGLKQLGCEADHSPPSTAQVKDKWSYTSTLDICHHVVDFVNFTFFPIMLCNGKTVIELWQTENFLLSLNFVCRNFSMLLHGTVLNITDPSDIVSP